MLKPIVVAICVIAFIAIILLKLKLYNPLKAVHVARHIVYKPIVCVIVENEIGSLIQTLQVLLASENKKVKNVQYLLSTTDSVNLESKLYHWLQNYKASYPHIKVRSITTRCNVYQAVVDEIISEHCEEVDDEHVVFVVRNLATIGKDWNVMVQTARSNTVYSQQCRWPRHVLEPCGGDQPVIVKEWIQPSQLAETLTDRVSIPLFKANTRTNNDTHATTTSNINTSCMFMTFNVYRRFVTFVRKEGCESLMKIDVGHEWMYTLCFHALDIAVASMRGFQYWDGFYNDQIHPSLHAYRNRHQTYEEYTNAYKQWVSDYDHLIRFPSIDNYVNRQLRTGQMHGDFCIK